MMKTKKVLLSNTTNSSKLDDQLSRIFVGNLNTSQICKKHMLKLFNKYGQIKAISMHKGYAFIQYFNKEHAELAVQKMHGEKIKGQLIDVNLVNDPKPYQKNKNLMANKNQIKSSTEDSKKEKNNSLPEIDLSTKNDLKYDKALDLSSSLLPYNSFMCPIFEKYSLPNSYLPINDIMICGICKNIFNNFNLFVQHKQLFCSSSNRIDQ